MSVPAVEGGNASAAITAGPEVHVIELRVIDDGQEMGWRGTAVELDPGDSHASRR